MLDTMFDLPGLEGVGEVVISKQVIDGTAPPLYIMPTAPIVPATPEPIWLAKITPIAGLDDRF